MIIVSISDKKVIVNSKNGKGSIVNKNIFVFLAVLSLACVLLTFSSCSFIMNRIDAKLDDMGLSKEGEKVKDVWNTIGKEAVDGAFDDVLCALDLKDEKDWPSDGIGALVPKPYYSRLESVKCDQDKGVIVITSFTRYEKRKYIELLGKEGFEKYSDKVPEVYLNSANGVAVCPVYTEESERLELLYADGFASITLLIKETQD